MKPINMIIMDGNNNETTLKKICPVASVQCRICCETLTKVLLDFCTNGKFSLKMGTRKWLVLWGMKEEPEYSESIIILNKRWRAIQRGPGPKEDETENKVHSLSRIGGRFIPTIFKPITHCRSPRENIGRNGAPVFHNYGLGADSMKGVT